MEGFEPPVPALEAGGLPINRHPLFLCLLMDSMFSAPRTVFLHFKLALYAFRFIKIVVYAPTFTTFKLRQFSFFLFFRHKNITFIGS